MADAAAPRRSGGGGGGWQSRNRGRGYNRGSGGRFNGNQGANASSLPILDSQGSQQVITDMLEVSQGPYSGWRLYHKQETEQRKRRSPNWGEAETQLLLRLWADRVAEMKTTKRNGFMLEEMAQLLMAHGFSRSSTEVKTRIANLSQEYRMEMRKRSLGFPHGSFKLWDAVHAILGEEPSSAAIAAASSSASQSSLEQQQQALNESWQEDQLSQQQQQQQQPDTSQDQSGEGPESLCCDIDPGMLMGNHDTGDEEEEEEGGEDEQEEEEGMEIPQMVREPLQQLNLSSPLNGLPNIPPSLTISLTPAPAHQTSNGSSANMPTPPPAHTKMPALIRVAPKRPSQDSNPPPPMPPLVRKPVTKRPRHSIDSSLLNQVKMDPPLISDLQAFRNYIAEESFDAGLGAFGAGGWALIAEQIRITNQIAESRAINLANLMEQQIKLQKQGLKMQKRILTLLEGMQQPSAAAAAAAVAAMMSEAAAMPQDLVIKNSDDSKPVPDTSATSPQDEPPEKEPRSESIS